jgi:chitin synthase
MQLSESVTTGVGANGTYLTENPNVGKEAPLSATVNRPNHIGTLSTNKQKKSCFQPWTWFVYLVTWWAPSFLLARFFGMPSPLVQRAWREKVALCSIVLNLCLLVSLGFFYLPNALCPPFLMHLDYTAIAQRKHLNTSYHSNILMIRGRFFNSSIVAVEAPESHFLGDVQASEAFREWHAVDLSRFFRPKLSDACDQMVRDATHRDNVYPPCLNEGLSTLEYCHEASRLKYGAMGVVGRKWEEVSGSDNLMVLNGYVVDMSHYVSTGLPIFGDQAHTLIMNGIGKDATPLFFSSQQQQLGKCLVELYPAGMVDSKPMGCLVLGIVYDWVMVLLVSVMGVRFLLALVFKWFMARTLTKVRTERKLRQASRADGRVVGLTRKNQIEKVRRSVTPAPSSEISNSSETELREWILRDMYTILFVTCYSEGEVGLRSTLESLAEADHPNHQKLLFIVCDGIVTGAGSTRSTPDIVLSLLDIHDRDPAPVSYVAVSEGARRHNMARIYTGFYHHATHRVPALVVVKCGTPSEATAAKPGNRGKRDSQVLLMSFFHKVLFDTPMSPLEYVLFTKIAFISGVTPDHFETVLMLDADTTIRKDALANLLSCFASDDRVIAACGETRISNKTDSWVSAIQVFEYFITHHLAKAFESVFGAVTCLPGCFCMYRIKAPKQPGKTWLPVLAHPDVILDYAQPAVDTLHHKNLLLLGEDRFLTTLMLRNFPLRKLVFVPQAVCHTSVPADLEVLLSQRRRWINSTIHNLLELVLVRELCGTFCFSMQFLAFLELLGTCLLPVSIILGWYDALTPLPLFNC